jgi:hypothetical protein
MTDIEPLLFNLFVDDWKNLASFFVAPSIGLAVAYLLGADLLKIPFVSTEVPYKIPRQMLAVLATSLCFIAALTNACWLTLRTYSGPNPNVSEFTDSFFRPLEKDERDWLKKVGSEPVVDASLVIEAFDVRSDLRIFINNVRVFGSYQDCVWKFECRTNDQSAAQQALISHIQRRHVDDNLYPANKLNRLPLTIPLLNALRTGLNYIDVFSNNSGLIGCHVKATLVFKMLSGQVNPLTFNIVDGTRTRVPYRTIKQSATYRTCDQFRLPTLITLRASS